MAGATTTMHGHDHLPRFELLSQELGRAPDHQSREEEREDRVHEHADQADAHAPEDHLPHGHVEHADETGEGHHAVVHAVHRAVRRHRRRLAPEDRRAYAEADLFPFHVACHAHFREERVRLPLGGKGEHQPDQEKDRHGGEDGPALAAVADHPAHGKGQRHGYEQDGEHLQEVRGGVGVLEGVRRNWR